MSDELDVWLEKTEAERSDYAREASSHLPPISEPFLVSDADLTAMRAAFVARFDEPLPKSETLMRVAAIGYRMAIRDA